MQAFNWCRPLGLVVVDGLHLIGDHLDTIGKSRIRVGTNIGIERCAGIDAKKRGIFRSRASLYINV